MSFSKISFDDSKTDNGSRKKKGIDTSSRRSQFNNFPLALFSFNEMGPGVEYYDFNEYNSFVVREDQDLESYLQNLAMITLVSLGGLTYYHYMAIFDIPAGRVEDHRLMIVTFNPKVDGNMENQQALAIFIPESIYTRLPSLAKMEHNILNNISKIIGDHGRISDANISWLKKVLLLNFAKNYK
jgi:hypothetical protein